MSYPFIYISDFSHNTYSSCFCIITSVDSDSGFAYTQCLIILFLTSQRVSFSDGSLSAQYQLLSKYLCKTSCFSNSQFAAKNGYVFLSKISNTDSCLLVSHITSKCSLAQSRKENLSGRQ